MLSVCTLRVHSDKLDFSSRVFLTSTFCIVFAVSGCPDGREFLTTFPESKGTELVHELIITAYESKAIVNVWSPDFSKRVAVPKGKTVTTELPRAGSTNKMVRITSDTDVTVVSSKLSSANRDGSVILPTSQLGTDYVVFTPRPNFSAGSAAHVTIVNGDKANKVKILPSRRIKGTKKWKNNKQITLKLMPNEVYQLKSSRTLTGTTIKSTHPVAVLAGTNCVSYFQGCADVFEQLIPVQRLSNYYLVPTMRKKDRKDKVYVVAHDDNTLVSFVFNSGRKREFKLHAGEKKSIRLHKVTSFAVSSNNNVMVMHHRSQLPREEFLTNILPTSEMANMWMLNPKKTARVVIIAEAKGSNTISLVNRWRSFLPDKHYVWTTEKLRKANSPVAISGEAPMIVYVFGKKTRTSYGTTGVCFSGELPISCL